MNDLYGDAFKDDQRDEKLYGVNIVDSKLVHSCDHASDNIPDPRSNNVSFMKVEELSRDCRNVLAVSESNICYSVTQKKNLLRIIDTQMGEKVILRGHEHFVADLTFSVVDPTLLCSVDNGAGDAEKDGAGKPHTVVWNKSKDGDWKVSAELPLRATLVRAHPKQAHLWLVGRGDRLGLFNSQPSAAQPVAAYEALPAHIVLEEGETVIDATFSACGAYIAVAVHKGASAGESLRVYGTSAAGPGGRLPVRGGEVLVPRLTALQWPGSLLVTVSAPSPATASATPTVDYSVQVWACVAGEVRGGPVQGLTLQLPRSTQGTASSALRNPFLECALSAEPGPEPRYVLLSSRRSNYVACLAVRPASCPSGVGQPLYHLTCLNLHAPVISVGVVTVLGQAHYSAEAGEHLEVSCYQECASEPGQASVQQYHVLFAQAFSFAAYMQLPQVQAQGDAQRRQAQPALTPNPNPNSAPKAVAAEGAGSAASSNNKGQTILSMLNNFQRPSSSGSPATPGTPVSTALSTSAGAPALTSPGIVRPSPSHAVTPTSTPSSSAAPGGSGKAALDALLSGKKPSASNALPLGAAPASAASSAQGLPDFLLGSPPPTSSASILSVLKAAKPAPIPSPVPAPKTPVTPAAPSAAPAPVPVPVPSSTAPVAVPVPSAAPQPSLEVPKVSAPVLSKAPPARLSKTPSEQQHPAATEAAVMQLVRELQASLNTAHLAQQEQAAQAMRQHQQQAALALQQSAKELQAAQVKHSEGLLAAVKKAVEGEARRAVDQSAASAGTLRVEMSEQIMKELVPSVSGKIRDSVRDTVRDSVKAQLPAAVRESFEGALLPAFEVAAAAMFQQLQGAFVQGMQGVLAESVRVQQGAAAHSQRLEEEVQELRGSVHRLEATVTGLVELLQGALGGGGALAPAQGSAAQPSPEPEPVEDAFSMLKQGRISDAVVRVLEDKDIAVTVALLEQLSPSQVTGACSQLERLCITQQLAADLSVNIPIEGIGKRVDWIKCLVLSLLSASGGQQQDPHYEQHFRGMIGAVLDSISAAKQLIYSAQYDTGEEDGLSALQIPQSVGTDLHLLEFVIQSKMK